MSDLKSQLQDYVEANVERVDIDDLASTVLAQPEARPQPRRARRAWLTPPRRPLGVASAAAMIVVLVIGSAWMLTLRGEDSPVVTQTTMAPAEGSWNPILSTTRAKAAPPAATCPPGTDPNTPGPTDQERPGPGPWSNQAAVFDQHTGRIVYVDEMGETWTFDVCTNTWQRMDPEGSVPPEFGGGPLPGDRMPPAERPELFIELVYDVDSDRVIAVGSETVHIYDAGSNTWERRDPPAEIDLASWAFGAVYDPASGLVLQNTGEGSLIAYDVETDEWTAIGIITEQREVTFEGQTKMLGPPFMIGYVAEADRIAFLGSGAPFQADGGLLNPRTGSAAPLGEPPGGVVGGGWGGLFVYATGGDTAYILLDTLIGPGTTSIGVGSMRICRLDPTTFEWACSSHQPPGIKQTPSAMVIDSVNNRLVIINDYCCVWPGSTTTNDVWAIDLDTGETIELLGPSTP